MVGLGRVELPTSPLSGVRSSQLSYRPVEKPGITGGAGRDRTGDLLNANQALSQLSYSPWFGIRDWGFGIPSRTEKLEPIPNPQSLTPNLCIEADWTLPAGTRPN